eukprot:jgi/Mesvir1/7886/Mv11819-RA.1
MTLDQQKWKEASQLGKQWLEVGCLSVIVALFGSVLFHDFTKRGIFQTCTGQTGGSVWQLLHVAVGLRRGSAAPAVENGHPAGASQNGQLAATPSTDVVTPPADRVAATLASLTPGDRALAGDSSDLSLAEDEVVARLVTAGLIPSHSLESRLGDEERAARVRCRAIEIRTGATLSALPLAGLDYKLINGACCEMVIGHVQLPVGMAGPLLVDGRTYMVPMATLEGGLVYATCVGCRAITQSGGCSARVTAAGMTRAPVVCFPTMLQALACKQWVEDEENQQVLAAKFATTSRFGRLKRIECKLSGRYLFLRFVASTGDAMGMNMVSKGVAAALTYLQGEFDDMQVVSISGNYCADKKCTSVNWIMGRGRSVVVESLLTERQLSAVLQTTAKAMAEVNVAKNFVGSAMAGSLGGFNAHAGNMVEAVMLACGQDPAQNVESSSCMTHMEVVGPGQKDLLVSVTLQALEVGTVGGGTIIPGQRTALEMLGVKGADLDQPGGHADTLARIIGATVLAGEIGLMALLTQKPGAKETAEVQDTAPDYRRMLIRTYSAGF